MTISVNNDHNQHITMIYEESYDTVEQNNPALPSHERTTFLNTLKKKKLF